MKKKTLILIVIILLLTITGCWDKRPVDELGIIANITIEKADSADRIKMNIIRPTFEKDKKEYDHKTTVEGKTLMKALDELQKRGSKLYLLGSVKNVLIGNKMAQSGINNILSELDHISDFESQALLAIFDSTIEELEAFNPLQHERIGILINDTLVALIKKQLIPETKFYEVMSTLALDGHEIILPVIKIDDENNSILVEKLGVFKGDKMVGSISIAESIPLMIVILSKINGLPVNISNEETKQYGIENLSVIIRNKKVKIKTSIEEDIPIINIDFTLTVDQQDFIPSNPTNIEQNKTSIDKENIVKSIENSVSNCLEKEMQKLIKQTQQEFESDVFGFGEKVRVQNNEYFKNINWKEVYPEAKITCSFKVNLRKLGTVK